MPDTVHVMSGGKIVRTGGKELALELEQNRLPRFRHQVPLPGRRRNRRMVARIVSSRTDAEVALADAFRHR